MERVRAERPPWAGSAAPPLSPRLAAGAAGRTRSEKCSFPRWRVGAQQLSPPPAGPEPTSAPLGSLAACRPARSHLPLPRVVPQPPPAKARTSHPLGIPARVTHWDEKHSLAERISAGPTVNKA